MLTFLIVLGVVVYLLIGGFCAAWWGMDDTDGGRYIATMFWPFVLLFVIFIAISDAPSALFIWLKKRRNGH